MPSACAQVRVVVGDRFEHALVVADEVHLVHREHHVPQPEQRRDVGVPARLHQQALARIDEHDREFRGRCARRHVARVLLVPRAVGDDVLALFGIEEAVRDVDGDALLAFGGQAVHQQRVVDLRALRAMAAAVGGERGSWSSNKRLLSYSKRPISVLLPSSTLPQVMKRSRSLCSCRRRASATLAAGSMTRHQK